MATLNAIYVRVSALVSADLLLGEFPEAELEQNKSFWSVVLPQSQQVPPERRLLDLSTRIHSDVIWYSFQTGVGAFQFHHWRSGTRLRSLVFGIRPEPTTLLGKLAGLFSDGIGEDPKWERVDGDAEPWEREAFFRDSDLASVLKYAGADLDRIEIQRIWRAGEIRVGQVEPSPDGRVLGERLATHFDFPGWDEPSHDA